MEKLFLTAQIIGIIAFFLSTLKYQIKCVRNVLWIECAATSLWAIHIFLLGGISAAIVNSIAVVRAVLCLKLTSKYLPAIVWGAFSLAAFLIIPSINGLSAILPLIGFGFYGLACLFQYNPLYMRISCLAGDSIWLLYALIIFSLPLALTCFLSILSSVYALYRYERQALSGLFIKPRTYP